MWGDWSPEEWDILSERIYYYCFNSLLKHLRGYFPIAQMFSFPFCIICEEIERGVLDLPFEALDYMKHVKVNRNFMIKKTVNPRSSLNQTQTTHSLAPWKVFQINCSQSWSVASRFSWPEAKLCIPELIGIQSIFYRWWLCLCLLI